MEESRRPGPELARVFVTGLIGGAGAGLIAAIVPFGSWNVISACQVTDDFCGNANVTTLLIGGVV